MTTLRFVIPYLGRWPHWMPLFLDSCAMNPHVGFLLLADTEPDAALPPNVEYVPCTRPELETRAREVLGLDVSLADAHKICDLRPFFALLFEEFLYGSEFWGYCDLDVVFGDLSLVTGAAALGAADVVTAYDRYAAGHFTLVRNCSATKGIGFQVPEWRERLKKTTWTMMDEAGLHGALARQPHLRVSRPRDVAAGYQMERAAAGFTVLFDGRGDRLEAGDRYRAIWKDGHTYVYDDVRGHRCEVLYLHFMGLKRRVHWRKYDAGRRYTECTFTSAGFHPGAMTSAEWESLPERAWRFAIRRFVLARAFAGRVVPREKRKAFRARAEVVFRRAG